MNHLNRLFSENLKPRQRQYEALRSIALEDKSYEQAAQQFGYTTQTVRNIKNLALSGKLDFFPNLPKGPVGHRVPPKNLSQIIELRKQGMSIYDIEKALSDEGNPMAVRTISRVLKLSGFHKLERRTDHELGVSRRNTLLSDRAGRLDFNSLEPFKIDCPVAGIFLFIPYILESGILDIVQKCHLPKSTDIDAVQASLSMLLFKLMGSERLSHIQQYDQEPGLGIFAGLNVLPKSSYLSTYSCRTSASLLETLQIELVRHLQSRFPFLYQSSYINLDFHSIPHFGLNSQMEKVWCGARGKTLKGANTLLAQDGSSNVILYTKADILRKNETDEIKAFAQYWKEIKGSVNETLVFDCKLTKYKVLGELDGDDYKIKFITLRKRHAALLEATENIAQDKWQKVYLPIPKRKNQRFLAYEEQITLRGCPKPFRQIIIKDHGRARPTFVITNNQELALQEVLEVYAKRWHIETKISELVSFFNLNALSSPLMVRIQFDLFWSIVADTLYHLLALDLPRFENCQAPTLFRKFINFPGRIEYTGREFKVKIRKRAHTPVLLGVKKLNESHSVPWLNNLPLHISWTA